MILHGNDWRQRLQAGEWVRPAYRLALWGGVALFSLGAAAFAGPWLSVMQSLIAANEPVPGNRLPAESILWLCAFPILLLVALSLWISWLLRAIRFADDRLQLRDCLGRLAAIEYEEAIALDWRSEYASPGEGGWAGCELRVCWFPLGFPGKSRWLNLRVSNWNARLAEAVRDEIIGRCRLAEYVVGAPALSPGSLRVWVRADIADLSFSTYDVAGTPARAPLIGTSVALVLAATAAAGWVIMGKPGDLAAAGLLFIALCFGFVVYFVRDYLTWSRRHAIRVRWDHAGVALRRPDGDEAWIQWSDITDARALPGDELHLFAAENPLPFVVPLSHDPSCLAFVSALRKQGKLES